MKKIIIVLAVAVIAFLAYYLFKKGKEKTVSADQQKLPPLPPVSTPPINQSLLLTDSGPGGAAVSRRIDEISKSEEGQKALLDVRGQVDILKGVTSSKAPYYDQNISRGGITSARDIPYNLNSQQKSALANFLSINTSNGTVAADNLLAANRQMLREIGTCFIGDPELQNTDEFIRQVYCQKYVDCGKNYRNMGAAPLRLKGGQMAAGDMEKMASAWLAGAEMYESKVKSMAIADLRAAGWKFAGFDA